MKRFLFCLTALLAILSCTKHGVDPLAPAIVWEANSSFDVQEMGDNMDGTIVLSAPLGISSLQIKCTKLPDLSRLVLTQWIGIQTYKSSLTMDVTSDELLAQTFADRKICTPAGESLVKAKACTLNMNALLEALIQGQPLENGTRFVFEITVTDGKNQKMTKTADFRWTAAAKFPDDIPSRYLLFANDDRTLAFDVIIYGKVDEFTISFGGDKADPKILEYVKKRTANGTATIDLVNDPNVKAAFDLNPVVKNAAKVNLNLSGLMKNLGYECSGPSTTTEMLISVKDVLGKVSQHKIALAQAEDPA